MIKFDHPWVLWFLLLIPVLVGLLWFFYRKRKSAAYQFAGPEVLHKVADSLSWSKLRFKATLWILAWTLIVVGLANPQIGTKLEEAKREGIDIVIALDISNSMLCDDIKPSRLESAKYEIQKFIKGLKGDRVGLIAFAGTAINHCPLTTDYSAVKLLVNVMSPDILPDPGTAIADAIEMAKSSYKDQDVKSKVLIIITDGEDHEQAAVEAAKKAAEAGIKIYTIGLGTPQGAPIPLRDQNGRNTGVKRDKSGQVIMTRLNELLLQQIAEAGDGDYLRGTQSAQELEVIWKDISNMEKREIGFKRFTAFEDRFQYLIFPAILLLLIEFFLSEKSGLALMLWIRSKILSKQKA